MEQGDDYVSRPAAFDVLSKKMADASRLGMPAERGCLNGSMFGKA